MLGPMQQTASKVLILLCVASALGQDDEYLKIKALGRPAHLGFLYDARLDRFLDFSVFKKPLPKTFVNTHETPFSNVKTSVANTFTEKFNLFDISASLSASVLSGMLTIKGSAQFLMSEQKHSKEFTGALLLNCKTVTESLELYYTGLKNLFNTDLITHTEATHVVTGISWGANVVVIFKDTVTDEKDETKIAGSLEIEFKKLGGPFQVSGSAKVDIHGKGSNETSTFEISVQGDILLPYQIPSTHEEVKELINEVPQLISSTSGGKGVAVEFTLTPIGRLRSHLEFTSRQNNFAAKIDETILNSFITVFDNMLSAEKLVNDNYELFRLNQICVLRSTWRKVRLLKRNFGTAKTSFTTAFQTALIKVRSSEADSTELSKLVEEIESNEFGPSNVEILLDEFQDARSKVEQYKVIVNSHNRIQYFGATNDLEAALIANTYKVMYILFFKSEWIRNDVTAWENTIHTFLHILNKPHNTLLVADCDFNITKCIGLNRAVIMQIVNGRTIIEDVDAAIRMSKNNMKMIVKGLGTRAQVGELYDARTDTFLKTSILKASYSKSLIQSTVQNTTQTVTVASEAIQDKLEAFQVTEEQRLSILAGNVPPFRTGKYLAMSTQPKSKDVYRQSILRTARAADEMLDFTLPDFTDDLLQENLFYDNPTHFVTKIEHGYNAVFSVKASCTIKDPTSDLRTGPNTDICKTTFPEFKAKFFQLVSNIGLSREQGSLLGDLQLLENSTIDYKIFVYADTQGRDSPPLTFNDMDSFYQFLTSGFIPNNRDQNAPAITYYLTPISSLQKIGIVAQPATYGSLTSNNYTSLDIISIRADIKLAREQMFQVSQKLRNNAHCITDKDFNLLKKIEHEFESSVGVFQNNYKDTVLKIKSGALSKDSLEKLISEYKSYTLFDNSIILTRLQPLLPADNKVRFCKTFENTSVKYFGRENSSVNFQAIFEPKPVRVSMVYLLHFKSSWLVDNNDNNDLWQTTSQLFVGQLSRRVRNHPAVYYIVDCDFEQKHCANITRPSIFEYKNGLLTTMDYKETLEEEEVTLQGQLDELNARVIHKIATVETEVTKNKNSIGALQTNISKVITMSFQQLMSLGTELTAVNRIAVQNQAQIPRVTDKIAAVESKVTANENKMVALRTELDAVKRTATQNQIKIRSAHACEEEKPAFIANATKSARFGCGGTIQLPSKGESIVLDLNLAATTGATQRCLWTLQATQNNKLVSFKVKLTLLCQQPTHILDDNTLTFTEWYLDGLTNKEITTNRISSSSQDSFLLSNHLDVRGFLSFNSKRMNSKAGFVLRIDVIHTLASSTSRSRATLKESFGSVPYSIPSSQDYSSIVINPQPAAKMTLTVDVDSSGASNPCQWYDSVDILEFGMDGIPNTLGRLCGRQSAISYETENPVATLFYWEGGRSGRGVKLTWK